MPWTSSYAGHFRTEQQDFLDPHSPHQDNVVSPRSANIRAQTYAQRFYLGHYKSGLVWMLTGGLFLIGWIVDGIYLSEMCQEYNQAVFQRQQVDQGSAILDSGVDYWQPIGGAESQYYGQPDAYDQQNGSGKNGHGAAVMPGGGGADYRPPPGAYA